VSVPERDWRGPAEGCCWAWSFADGVAVYHSLTGSTHVLPESAWQVLHAVVHGCATASTVQVHLLSRGWVFAREEIEGTLEALHAARLAAPAF